MDTFDVNPNLKTYKYSVCMLIFHRSQELVDMAMDCLTTVLNTINRDETQIIVCDNGSTVRTSFWEDNSDVYIRHKANMGISRGWNDMLKVAKGEYMVIIGDDLIFDRSGWLEAMREGMEMPLAGMCNPHIEHLPYGQGIVENPKWPSGACFMLNRNTIDKVGYFNEKLFFPAQFEDTSYWTRLYKSGLHIYTNYKIMVRHKEGQTDKSPDISVHFEKNKQKFIEVFGFDPVPYFYGASNLEDVMPHLQENNQWRE